jgi:hypothetical protein
MSYQESDPISKKEYLKLANECFLLKNRKTLLEDWMKNVGDTQIIEKGKKEITEINRQLGLLETELKNHAYTETDEYARTNEYLQEFKDRAYIQELDAARQRALLNKKNDEETAKFYKDYERYTKPGGSKSRRRHRRHRKHARKTRRKRAHRSRAARKHKKYSRRR